MEYTFEFIDTHGNHNRRSTYASTLLEAWEWAINICVLEGITSIALLR